MPTRRTFWIVGVTAAASWLAAPGLAQDDGAAIPEELRIIQDPPPPTEPLGDVGQLRNEDRDETELMDDDSAVLDEDWGSLFADDRSLMFDTRDDTPAEELLPEDIDPDTELVDRPTAEDRGDLRIGEDDIVTGPPADIPGGDEALGGRLSGPQDLGAGPPDRFDPGAGRSAGGSSGGGSLF